MAHLFSSGSLPATALASLVATQEASEPARVPSGLGWHLTGSSWPATTRSVEQAGVPTGWFSAWNSSVRASKRVSVAGTIPLDDSKRPTWNTVADILAPNKITLNLKINTKKLSKALNDAIKKMGSAFADATDKAILAFGGMAKAMTPIGVLRSGSISFPISWDDRVADCRRLQQRSGPIVASGQVSYAPVVHETFSKLRADEIVAKLLKRYG